MGQLTWTTAMAIAGQCRCAMVRCWFWAWDCSWLYSRCRWISRMWARDYLRVLKKRNYILGGEGCRRDNRFRHPCAGYSDLWLGCSLSAVHIMAVGGDSIVHLRFRWRDEPRTLSMGATAAQVTRISTWMFISSLTGFDS